MAHAPALWNALVPGAAALARGRTAFGAVLLAAGAACAAAMALGAIGLPGLPPRLAAWAAVAYAAVAVLAAGAERAARAQPLDPERVRAAHRSAAGAWLRGRPEALEHARALARLAPRERGAWELLALVARSQGAPGDLARAQRALDALDAAAN
jgi:hypothetical protein